MNLFSVFIYIFINFDSVSKYNYTELCDHSPTKWLQFMRCTH